MGQVCQGREQKHRHFVCTETRGKFPLFLPGSSRAPGPCSSCQMLAVILYILSCRLALGNLAKMVIKCWVWPVRNLLELLEEPMVSFKTPDTAGDEDISERQPSTKGHRNSVNASGGSLPRKHSFPRDTGQPSCLAERFLHALLHAAEEIRSAIISIAGCISL